MNKDVFDSSNLVIPVVEYDQPPWDIQEVFI